MPNGSCHCGAIKFSVKGESRHAGICHCEDCRKTTGGLTSAWIAYDSEALTVVGAPQTYASSEGVERQFCGECGTSLFYFNHAVMPGVVDILTVTFEDPENYPPPVHVQMAEALPWEAEMDALPKFDRFPG